MRYGSLCSGIEAASVAWNPLGWTPAFFSEIEGFPSAVLAHHYPETPNLGDMTKFKDWPDYAIDVLVGGTPCQAFSIAGLRKGLADPRGNLALTFLAIVDRYRPKWVVWENVPGVHSSWSDAETFAASEESGEIIEAARRAVESAGIDLGADFLPGDFEECDQTSDFDCFLAGLAELGYGVATRVLDAQYVRVESHPRAVPQRRRRVFVVGHLGDWRRAAAVLFERACLSGNPPPRREAGKGPTGTLAARTKGGSGLGTDFDLGGGQTAVAPTLAGTSNGGGANGPGRDVDSCESLQVLCGEIVPQAMSSKWSKGTSGPAGDEVRDLVAHSIVPPITGNPYGDHESRDGLLVAHSLTGEGFDASEDGSGRGTPVIAVAFNHKASSHQSMNPSEVSPALDVGKSGGVCVAFSCKDHGADAGEVAPTLRSMGHDGMAPTRSAVRRLVPTECEVLMGLPRGYTDVPFRGKPACDGPRYKSLGNSFAVNCLSWIGQRIQEVKGMTPALSACNPANRGQSA